MEDTGIKFPTPKKKPGLGLKFGSPIKSQKMANVWTAMKSRKQVKLRKPHPDAAFIESKGDSSYAEVLRKLKRI